MFEYRSGGCEAKHDSGWLKALVCEVRRVFAEVLFFVARFGADFLNRRLGLNSRLAVGGSTFETRAWSAAKLKTKTRSKHERVSGSGLFLSKSEAIHFGFGALRVHSMPALVESGLGFAAVATPFTWARITSQSSGLPAASAYFQR